MELANCNSLPKVDRVAPQDTELFRIELPSQEDQQALEAFRIGTLGLEYLEVAETTTDCSVLSKQVRKNPRQLPLIHSSQAAMQEKLRPIDMEQLEHTLTNPDLASEEEIFSKGTSDICYTNPQTGDTFHLTGLAKTISTTSTVAELSGMFAKDDDRVSVDSVHLKGGYRMSANEIIDHSQEGSNEGVWDIDAGIVAAPVVDIRGKRDLTLHSTGSFYPSFLFGNRVNLEFLDTITINGGIARAHHLTLKARVVKIIQQPEAQFISELAANALELEVDALVVEGAS